MTRQGTGHTARATAAARGRTPRANPWLLTEHQEQAALIRWARAHQRQHPELRLLFAIPNGGARTKVTGGILKAEGVKAGVPDLCLPVARLGCHALYIEMKRREGGKLSAEQAQWRDDLTEQGHRVVVCRGWEAARDALVDYLTAREGGR